MIPKSPGGVVSYFGNDTILVNKFKWLLNFVNFSCRSVESFKVKGERMPTRLLHTLVSTLVVCTLAAFAAGCSATQTSSRGAEAPANPSLDQGGNEDVSAGQVSQVVSGANILSAATLARVIVEGTAVIPILKNGSKARRIAAFTRIDIKGEENSIYEVFTARVEEFTASGKYLSFPIPSNLKGAVSLVVTDSKTGVSASVEVIPSSTPANGGSEAGGGMGYLVWLHNISGLDMAVAVSSGEFLSAMGNFCASDATSSSSIVQESPSTFPLIGRTNVELMRGKQIYLTGSSISGSTGYHSAGTPAVTDATYFGAGPFTAARPRMANGIPITESTLTLLIGIGGGDCNDWSNFNTGSISVSTSALNEPRLFTVSSGLGCSDLSHQGMTSYYLACATPFQPR